MRFAGIDIASEKHVVAVVDEQGGVVTKATTFTEDKAGYAALLELLGPPAECMVAMEATGHYWQNLFAVLAAAGQLEDGSGAGGAAGRGDRGAAALGAVAGSAARGVRPASRAS